MFNGSSDAHPPAMPTPPKPYFADDDCANSSVTNPLCRPPTPAELGTAVLIAFLIGAAFAGLLTLCFSGIKKRCKGNEKEILRTNKYQSSIKGPQDPLEKKGSDDIEAGISTKNPDEPIPDNPSGAVYGTCEPLSPPKIAPNSSLNENPSIKDITEKHQPRQKDSERAKTPPCTEHEGKSTVHNLGSFMEENTQSPQKRSFSIPLAPAKPQQYPAGSLTPDKDSLTPNATLPKDKTQLDCGNTPPRLPTTLETCASASLCAQQQVPPRDGAAK
ncbi:hypothetical protein RLOatenuis_3150 [Rickettsiales bacterium]|nr:hypothetical protein RLOatenuis_3150 [Rickettsiales bacterium]